MKPFILTRERLTVILRSIDQNGGSVSIRHLMRNHEIWGGVIDEAVEKGFVKIETRKPARGRPSRVLRKVSQSHTTKLPPYLESLEDIISCRHWNFAMWYVAGEFGADIFSFRRRAWTAYKKAFPKAQSDKGARASASRLMKMPHIQAAIQWEFAVMMDRLKISGRSPQTTSEIWFTLLDHRSYRARLAPWWYRQQWLDAQSEGET